jgi:hypothetical protein
LTDPVATWRAAWERFIPFLAFAPEVRRIIDTTNAIESLTTNYARSSRTAVTSQALRHARSGSRYRGPRFGQEQSGVRRYPLNGEMLSPDNIQ